MFLSAIVVFVLSALQKYAIEAAPGAVKVSTQTGPSTAVLHDAEVSNMDAASGSDTFAPLLAERQTPSTAVTTSTSMSSVLSQTSGGNPTVPSAPPANLPPTGQTTTNTESSSSEGTPTVPTTPPTDPPSTGPTTTNIESSSSEGTPTLPTTPPTDPPSTGPTTTNTESSNSDGTPTVPTAPPADPPSTVQTTTSTESSNSVGATSATGMPSALSSGLSADPSNAALALSMIYGLLPGLPGVQTTSVKPHHTFWETATDLVTSATSVTSSETTAVTTSTTISAALTEFTDAWALPPASTQSSRL
ncbi:MAG: hypothetical protein Q9165_008173 [Trypethelium subeluteriae]